MNISLSDSCTLDVRVCQCWKTQSLFPHKIFLDIWITNNTWTEMFCLCFGILIILTRYSMNNYMYMNWIFLFRDICGCLRHYYLLTKIDCTTRVYGKTALTLQQTVTSIISLFRAHKNHSSTQTVNMHHFSYRLWLIITKYNFFVQRFQKSTW